MVATLMMLHHIFMMACTEEIAGHMSLHSVINVSMHSTMPFVKLESQTRVVPYQNPAALSASFDQYVSEFNAALSIDLVFESK